MCATTNHYYNQGVINTFAAISNLPKTVGGLYDQAIAQLNAVQTPETKPAKWIYDWNKSNVNSNSGQH